MQDPRGCLWDDLVCGPIRAEGGLRSGGHCFVGRSSTEGIVVDVSPKRSVLAADSVATIGVGARLSEVYDALDGDGWAVPVDCGPFGAWLVSP